MANPTLGFFLEKIPEMLQYSSATTQIKAFRPAFLAPDHSHAPPRDGNGKCDVPSTSFP
jgi:hypothetical protein